MCSPIARSCVRFLPETPYFRPFVDARRYWRISGVCSEGRFAAFLSDASEGRGGAAVITNGGGVQGLVCGSDVSTRHQRQPNRARTPGRRGAAASRLATGARNKPEVSPTPGRLRATAWDPEVPRCHRNATRCIARAGGHGKTAAKHPSARRISECGRPDRALRTIVSGRAAAGSRRSRCPAHAEGPWRMRCPTLRPA